MFTISEEETAATLLTVDDELRRMVAHDLAVLFCLALLLHTAAKWPILLQLRHSFPAAGQSAFMWEELLPQYPHPPDVDELLGLGALLAGFADFCAPEDLSG